MFDADIAAMALSKDAVVEIDAVMFAAIGTLLSNEADDVTWPVIAQVRPIAGVKLSAPLKPPLTSVKLARAPGDLG